MKVILALLGLSFSLLWQAQTNVQPAADLLVIKFSCGRYEEPSRVIRSVQDPDPPMNEPVTIVKTNKNVPQDVKNEQDLKMRGAELRGMEADANRSRESKSNVHSYFYRIEIRNTAAKIMKSFAWQYQSGEVPDPNDRQFFCAVNAKPNSNKEFDLFSPLGPSRVIDARAAGNNRDKDQKDRVIINQIEYADGSVWRRPTWNPKTFLREDTDKVAAGKCIGL